jgi:hypothetical protein
MLLLGVSTHVEEGKHRNGWLVGQVRPDRFAAQPDDVGRVDPDPEVHAAFLREARVACSKHSLDLDCAADRVESRRKLGQDVVARRVHDPGHP